MGTQAALIALLFNCFLIILVLLWLVKIRFKRSYLKQNKKKRLTSLVKHMVLSGLIFVLFGPLIALFFWLVLNFFQINTEFITLLKTAYTIGFIPGVATGFSIGILTPILYDMASRTWITAGIGYAWAVVLTCSFLLVNELPSMVANNDYSFLNNLFGAFVIAIFAAFSTYIVGWIYWRVVDQIKKTRW